MVGLIQNGYDLVIGSRLMRGGKNLLGWHRRLFTRGSALFCRISWGTFGIEEYTNSYRVFSKKLFEKIDFKKIPWKSKTYIIQPAFLYGAIKAGAKIKEIPITFQDRKQGYSKAKIFSYTLEVFKFGIMVRLEKSAFFLKFLVVGTISYFINAIFLGLLSDGQLYSTKVLSTPILNFFPPVGFGHKFLFAYLDRLFFASIISNEIAIVFNFIAHENWTFKSRSHKGMALLRFTKFNFSSLASPIISIITIQIFVHHLRLDKQIGLAVGVIIGLFVNYAINILWIWKEKPTKEN
jgi:putative flippase GtrA